ncbi:beta-phosphoglucomutase [Rhodococcus sp. LBL1]|nr:beta-phosphoglucomutase [Rhodococcus sp. LBL1]MDH6684231.1 beta-phosphoglucomutase [Rhodococcus sp. LBL2]
MQIHDDIALPERAPSSQPSHESVDELLAGASALLIDFNGTLSDDEELVAELVAEVAREELGVELSRSRYFDEFLGYTEADMFRELSGITDAVRLRALVDVFNGKYLDRVRAQPRITHAAMEFVREARARGKSIAVVTAASRSVVIPALSSAGLLPEIDTVVALEDVDRSKPEPDCYLLALQVLDVDATNALAFEDSRTGVTAAQAAGLRVIAVGRGSAVEPLESLTSHAVDNLCPELLWGMP